MVLYFDVGDVLVKDCMHLKFPLLAAKYGLELADLQQTRKKYRPLADAGKISDPEFWQLCLQDLGIKAQPEDWQLDSCYQEVPGVRGIVLALKAQGHRLAIISDDSREMAENRRRRWGYDGVFDRVIISSDLGITKPDERIFLHALKTMQSQPAESLFIDNLEYNLQGAARVGMRTLLFTNADQLQDDLNRMGLLDPGSGTV
ncbi:HAD family phosphatase [bacterium]|nr:HAD family phosphatase [bacterium]